MNREGKMSEERNKSKEPMTLVRPVGAMRRLVSLVDRGSVDDYLYPAKNKDTVLQPTYTNYHNFSTEILESNFVGHAAWGQRISFEVPSTAHADLLQWCSLVIKPGSWIPQSFHPNLTADDAQCYQPLDVSGSWTWTGSLGAFAIEKAELEVGGIVIDTIDGDWSFVSSVASLNTEQGDAWADSVTGRTVGAYSDTPYKRQFLVRPTEDGNIYCYLPFWFARRRNTAFPICSLQDNPLRIHITLRPFQDLVRRWSIPRNRCDETPADEINEFRDFTYSWPVFGQWKNLPASPQLLGASMLFGVVYLDNPLRQAYIERPHEILIEKVTTMRFTEPLKYTISISSADKILIGLPLTDLNGPLRRLFFFIRRKAVYRFNEWSNFGTYMQDEIDPLWNPQKPLLRHATLRVGTVKLVDQPEKWWRYSGAIGLPGSAGLYNRYIYTLALDGDGNTFGPNGGTLNSSRTDMRLDLEIQPPASLLEKEWEVVVFGVTYNWLRFQNGIANLLFAD
jgi:hypothetical protein